MKTCSSCNFFEHSTKFCRKLPPTPNEVTRYDKTSTISKWPVIPFPDKDFCGCWESIKKMEIINENG